MVAGAGLSMELDGKIVFFREMQVAQELKCVTFQPGIAITR